MHAIARTLHRFLTAVIGPDPALVEARRITEDAIMQCERAASVAQRALYEAHVSARGAGRSSIRALHWEKRALDAEGALEMSKAAPAKVMMMLLQNIALLETLAAASPCASCKIRHGHRYNCRLETALVKTARILSRYPRKPARHATGPVGLPKIIKHR